MSPRFANVLLRLAKYLAAAVFVLGGTSYGVAASLSQTLGNSAPGFADGSTPTVFPDIVNAQTGQPAPFDSGIGSDLFENGSASWTFGGIGAIVDPITSAFIRIGIADHDSAASGSQLLSFGITGSGVDLTGVLDALFEGSGGADGEYDIYTVVLPSSVFASLAVGGAEFNLSLQGPGLLTDIFNDNAPVASDFNGFFLIFSTLEITTRDQGNPVPEPGSLALAALGLLSLLGVTSRRRAVR